MPVRPPTRSPWHAPRPVGLRRARLDAFRVYAMAFVVLGHSELMLGTSRVEPIHWVQLLLNIVSRAAVPLFLILAGEHLGPRIARDRVRSVAWHYVRRLAALYAVGCLFYWATDFAKLVRSRGLGAGLAGFIARQGENPIGLLMHGPRPHLWFLLVLMGIVAAASLLLARWRLRYLVVATAVLYAAGLAFGAYRPQPDMMGYGWWLELLLQAPLFFAIGLVFGLEPERRSRTTAAVGLIAIGLVVHTLEVQWITQTHGTFPERLAMLAGTVLYATGVAMLALSPGGTDGERRIGQLAPYVPAVYLTHIFFLETLRPPAGLVPEAWLRLALPVVATTLAFATAWLFYRVRRWMGRSRRRSSGWEDAQAAP